MANSQEWDVTVSCRIENVTDHDNFPELLQSALQASEELTVIRLTLPSVPHTTSAVVRVIANSKTEAERSACEIVLRAVRDVARALVGDQAFGWALSADAVLGQSSMGSH